MSVRVMSLVWDNFKDGGTPKLVMLAMADWCNDAGGSLHPSISAISKKVCVSEKQARRIVHELIEQNYLSVVGNQNGGHPGSSRQYVLNIEMIATPPASVTPPSDVTPPLQGSTPLPPVSITPPAGVPYHSHGREPNHQEPPRTTNRTINKEILDAELPDWINREDWVDFVSHRKAIKKPITSVKHTIADLEKLHRQGANISDAIHKSIANGWQGVFMPKDKSKIPTTENFAAKDYGNGVTLL